MIIETQAKDRDYRVNENSSQEMKDFAEELTNNLEKNISLVDGKKYEVKFISFYMGKYTIEKEELEYSNSDEIFKDVFFIDNSVISRNSVIVVQ